MRRDDSKRMRQTRLGILQIGDAGLSISLNGRSNHGQHKAESSSTKKHQESGGGGKEEKNHRSPAEINENSFRKTGRESCQAEEAKINLADTEGVPMELALMVRQGCEKTSKVQSHHKKLHRMNCGGAGVPLSFDQAAICSWLCPLGQSNPQRLARWACPRRLHRPNP